MVSAMDHFDTSHASTMAVLLVLSGQLASVSTSGEPTVSYEFLSGYEGARRGSGCLLPHFGKGIPCEVAFSHSPGEAVAQAPSTFSFPLILYNNIMASVRSGRGSA